MTKNQAHKPSADVVLLGVEIPPNARCVSGHLAYVPYRVLARPSVVGGYSAKGGAQ